MTQMGLQCHPGRLILDRPVTIGVLFFQFQWRQMMHQLEFEEPLGESAREVMRFQLTTNGA